MAKFAEEYECPAQDCRGQIRDRVVRLEYRMIPRVEKWLLVGCVHLSLVDTYRCAHIGQHPYLISLRPDGFHRTLTPSRLSRMDVLDDFRSGEHS